MFLHIVINKLFVTGAQHWFHKRNIDRLNYHSYLEAVFGGRLLQPPLQQLVGRRPAAAPAGQPGEGGGAGRAGGAGGGRAGVVCSRVVGRGELEIR